MTRLWATTSAKRKLHGIDAVTKDNTALNVLISSINHKCPQLEPGCSGELKLVCHIILSVDEKAICHWKLEAKGLDGLGFNSKAPVNGMLYCRFNKQNKIYTMYMQQGDGFSMCRA
eukprot:CAMPEP_0206417594 /NCGR_PEP_ID=MMETSP0294-20121207/37420_1 /ASSEMBLY_ACC=CAM_ASM_000327 /TAXON_ID=39354 /ORGANISM="Heterosigma akashiwo, Strain CCMP2393" /LENGTH=115 /DNA_ID=CAMNT_0053880439 /DNA_START=278 /DNA_END=625 /DNA_ORIENTATION=+